MSTYKLLCLNHAPALVIDGTGRTFNQDRMNDAIGSAQKPAIRDWLIEEHGGCDLLVGEFSYPLVAVCCPGTNPNGSHQPHPGPVWVDREWLVLLYAGMTATADEPRLQAAVERLATRYPCWTRTRLERLAPLLGIEG